MAMQKSSWNLQNGSGQSNPRKMNSERAPLKHALGRVLDVLEAVGLSFRSWHSIAVLCVATLAVVTLTIRDTVVLFQTWAEEPTSTNTTIHAAEKYLFRPTICLPIVETQLACPYVNVSNRTEVAQRLSEFANTDVIAYFDSLCPEPYYEEACNRTPSAGALLGLTVLFLKELTISEGYRLVSVGCPNDRLYKWGNNATFLTYKFYREKRVSLVALQKSVGAYLCRLMGLSFKSYAWTGVNYGYDIGIWQPCAKESITWLGSGAPGYTRTMLCLKAESNPKYFSFNMTVDTFQILTNDEHLYNPNATTCPLDMWDHYQHFMRLDFGGDVTVSTDSDAPLQLRHSDNWDVTINVAALYNQIDLRKRHCLADERMSRFKCRAICRIRSFVQHCGCLPLSFFKLHDIVTAELKGRQLPICAEVELPGNYSFEDVIPHLGKESCRIVRKTFDVNESCASSCYPECTTRKLTFSVRQLAKSPDQIGSAQTVTEIMLADYSFPVFQEVFVFDWTYMISSIGGILGIYGSVLSVLVCLVSTVESLIARYCNKFRVANESVRMANR